jgi:hypothetical protein
MAFECTKEKIAIEGEDGSRGRKQIGRAHV